ncbi:flavoprotein [Catenuloplanes japonicus]|uniref:flavoprotein n=1 Tax=Catenuloplanes japonicus TaxID=33876 RepID=UPI001E34D02B|nr:flavoprotein [Catenuloplanes japonicus]
MAAGAGPAGRVGELIGMAQTDGWTVHVVATPAGRAFLDVDAIATQCGFPVRSDYRAPGDGGPRSSHADALIVAPATYNTINKLALGINDTYALNVVAEAIGLGRSVAVLPFVNTALAARRPFSQAVASLRAEGVHVVFGPGQWMPHAPGTGNSVTATVPWDLALAAVSSDCSA